MKKIMKKILGMMFILLMFWSVGFAADSCTNGGQVVRSTDTNQVLNFQILNITSDGFEVKWNNPNIPNDSSYYVTLEDPLRNSLKMAGGCTNCIKSSTLCAGAQCVFKSATNLSQESREPKVMPCTQYEIYIDYYENGNHKYVGGYKFVTKNDGSTSSNQDATVKSIIDKRYIWRNNTWQKINQDEVYRIGDKAKFESQVLNSKNIGIKAQLDHTRQFRDINASETVNAKSMTEVIPVSSPKWVQENGGYIYRDEYTVTAANCKGVEGVYLNEGTRTPQVIGNWGSSEPNIRFQVKCSDTAPTIPNCEGEAANWRTPCLVAGWKVEETSYGGGDEMENVVACGTTKKTFNLKDAKGNYMMIKDRGGNNSMGIATCEKNWGMNTTNGNYTSFCNSTNYEADCQKIKGLAPVAGWKQYPDCIGEMNQWLSSASSKGYKGCTAGNWVIQNVQGENLNGYCYYGNGKVSINLYQPNQDKTNLNQIQNTVAICSGKWWYDVRMINGKYNYDSNCNDNKQMPEGCENYDDYEAAGWKVINKSKYNSTISDLQGECYYGNGPIATILFDITADKKKLIGKYNKVAVCDGAWWYDTKLDTKTGKYNYDSSCKSSRSIPSGCKAFQQNASQSTSNPNISTSNPNISTSNPNISRDIASNPNVATTSTTQSDTSKCGTIEKVSGELNVNNLTSTGFMLSWPLEAGSKKANSQYYDYYLTITDNKNNSRGPISSVDVSLKYAQYVNCDQSTNKCTFDAIKRFSPVPCTTYTISIRRESVQMNKSIAYFKITTKAAPELPIRTVSNPNISRDFTTNPNISTTNPNISKEIVANPNNTPSTIRKITIDNISTVGANAGSDKLEMDGVVIEPAKIVYQEGTNKYIFTITNNNSKAILVDLSVKNSNISLDTSSFIIKENNKKEFKITVNNMNQVLEQITINIYDLLDINKDNPQEAKISVIKNSISKIDEATNDKVNLFVQKFIDNCEKNKSKCTTQVDSLKKVIDLVKDENKSNFSAAQRDMLSGMLELILVQYLEYLNKKNINVNYSSVNNNINNSNTSTNTSTNISPSADTIKEYNKTKDGNIYYVNLPKKSQYYVYIPEYIKSANLSNGITIESWTPGNDAIFQNGYNGASNVYKISNNSNYGVKLEITVSNSIKQINIEDGWNLISTDDQNKLPAQCKNGKSNCVLKYRSEGTNYIKDVKDENDGDIIWVGLNLPE